MKLSLVAPALVALTVGVAPACGGSIAQEARDISPNSPMSPEERTATSSSALASNFPILVNGANGTGCLQPNGSSYKNANPCPFSSQNGFSLNRVCAHNKFEISDANGNCVVRNPVGPAYFPGACLSCTDPNISHAAWGFDATTGGIFTYDFPSEIWTVNSSNQLAPINVSTDKLQNLFVAVDAWVGVFRSDGGNSVLDASEFNDESRQIGIDTWNNSAGQRAQFQYNTGHSVPSLVMYQNGGYGCVDDSSPGFPLWQQPCAGTAEDIKTLFFASTFGASDLEFTDSGKGFTAVCHNGPCTQLQLGESTGPSVGMHWEFADTQ